MVWDNAGQQMFYSGFVFTASAAGSGSSPDGNTGSFVGPCDWFAVVIP